MRDIIIIGSGPAGYTAAIYAARAQLNPIVVASSVEAGGELMNTTEVENYPGFPDGVLGPSLMDSMRRQAERFGTEMLMDDVINVDIETAVKRVELGSGTVLEARSLIYATGSAPRKLGVEGEARLSGYGVSYCATCDGFFFREKTIAVVGGGDSALEEATFLTRFATKVYLVHRRNELRGSKIMQQRAFDNEKIELVLQSEVSEVYGADAVEGIRLRSTVDGTTRDLPVSGLFVAVGNDPRTHLIHGKLELTNEGTVAVQGRTSLTSVDGVFAAGDVIDHSYRQAATAVGSGTVAALDAERFLATKDQFSASESTTVKVAL